MGKIIFTIAFCSICLLSAAQVRVVDTSAFDSITVLKGAVGVEHLIGIQKPAKATAEKGGLKVFIENAEQDDIIAATVQVMDGERQVAGGVTDFLGFVYIPNIEAGAYVVVIKHVNIGEVKFQITIRANSIYELREELTLKPFVQSVVIKAGGILTDRSTVSRCQKGGLKVFIENAEQDDIIAATVQVMDGELQVAGASTDFAGFVYIPNLEAGIYTVVIRHINIGEAKFRVTVQENEVYELREEIEIGNVLIEHFIGHPEPIFEDPYMTSYRTEDILRNPGVMRN